MKLFYKGYTIEVKREQCMAGYSLVYYSIFKGNRECTSGFSDSADTVRAWIGFMKERIDNEEAEAKPWDDSVFASL